MAAEGLDPDWYVTRHRTLDEVLPWDHITAGLHKDFLWQDWQAALAEHGLPDCRWTPCYDCGVCTDYALEHVVASPVPPAGGSQGTGQDLVAASAGAADAPVRFLGTRPNRSAVAVRGDTGFPVRLMYTKRGKIRWISHRDVARAMERAFRVTQLPLAFSEGFSPRPKVSFGLALSTGHESDAEYLDLEFLHEVDCDDLPPVLSEALPDGMAVVAAAPLVERAPALQEAVTAVVWQVEVVRGDGTPATPRSARRVRRGGTRRPRAPDRTAQEGPRGRRGRPPRHPPHRCRTTRNGSGRHRYGTRYGVVHAAAEREAGRDPHGDRASQRRPRRSRRSTRALRTHQWIERDGTRWEPQDADTRPRTPKARAS